MLSNQDNVEDLSHGLCVTNHDVNFLVNAQDTNSMTFTAGANRACTGTTAPGSVTLFTSKCVAGCLSKRANMPCAAVWH